MSQDINERIPASIDVIVSVPKGKEAEPSFEVRAHELGHWYKLEGERAERAIQNVQNHNVYFALGGDDDPVKYGLQKTTSKTIKGGVTVTKYEFYRHVDRSLLSRYSSRDRMQVFRGLFPNGTHAQVKDD